MAHESHPVNDTPFSQPELATFDPVGWHYAEQLSVRAAQATGPAQVLLHAKHQQVLQDLHGRWQAAQTKGLSANPLELSMPTQTPLTSPLAQLLQDMAPSSGQSHSPKPHAGRSESPRIEQLRKQLGQLSVQKQVTQALAQAPQNAGPINSHSLVLRALGLMRDVSPDYLNRFMGYVDTLLCLDASGTSKLVVKKKSTGTQTGP
jgi:hypothetical protein